MAFRKSIKGDENEQTEQLSHNRINRVSIEAGNAAFLVVAFLCFLASAALVFMIFVHQALLETLVVISFIAVFIMAWIIAGAFTWKQVSNAKTAVAVDTVRRDHAQVEAAVVAQGESWVLWCDNDGSYQFRTTTTLTENRQFLPMTTSAPSHQDTILTLYDQGMSGRSIEKHLKEKGVTYHQIQKTLSLYRPEWNRKTVESGQPEDEYPV